MAARYVVTSVLPLVFSGRATHAFDEGGGSGSGGGGAKRSVTCVFSESRAG